MMTGKTAFSNNSKKALGAIGSVSVLPIIFGLVGLFYFPGNAIYYILNSCSICRRYILHAIL